MTSITVSPRQSLIKDYMEKSPPTSKSKQMEARLKLQMENAMLNNLSLPPLQSGV